MKPAPAHLRPPPAPPVSTRWRLQRLITAPHRLGFFAATVLMVATAAWWALALWSRVAQLPLAGAVPATVAHGLVFALGFMPLYIIGFLFTAGPRWLALPDEPAARLLRPVLALCTGWLLAMVGFHVASALAALGVALAAAGWIAVVRRFRHLVHSSRVPDRTHPRVIAFVLAVGAFAMLAAAVGLVLESTPLVRAATQLAIWGFLAPTFATVSHRMIPFFTASALPSLDVWRPYWLLQAMLGALAASAAGAIAETLWWPLPTAARAVLLAVQAPAALLMLWLAWRWGAVQSLRIRMLAMLHGGFVWFGVALALAAASHTRVLLLGPEAGLGLAPLHALTMGYLGCTLVAMISRVATGHSGRALTADGLTWGLYLVVQFAALVRVCAAMWPAAAPTLTPIAVTAWAAGCGAWALRYGRWLGRPRADGGPG